MENTTRLSNIHRRFLIMDYGIVPTVLNLFINGLIAWVIFRSAESVPLWGASSIGVDLLVTAFLLPFLTCVIASGIVYRQVRSGKVPVLPRVQLTTSPWIRSNSFIRGVFLGSSGVLFAAVPVVWALDLGNSQSFTVSSYVLFKASWAALLAMVITPFVGWWALVSESSRMHTS